MSETKEIELPPLPEPYLNAYADTPLFITADMQAYGAECARLARLAEMERCSRICEAVNKEKDRWRDTYPWECAEELAAAIRASQP